MSEEQTAACLRAEDVNVIELWERREKAPACSENDPNEYG